MERRFSDYSTSGSSTTWKAGGTWAPVDSVKFRGIFQESVRSPNIFELFNPPTTGLNNLVLDPCQGTLVGGTVDGNPNPALANPDIQAICIAQGAPAGVVLRIRALNQGGASQPSRSYDRLPHLHHRAKRMRIDYSVGSSSVSKLSSGSGTEMVASIAANQAR